MVFLCSHYLLFFFLRASEAVTPHHGTFNSILSLIVACWCQSCHLGCSVIVLQGVACLLHFSPWRVLRSSTEQPPQWLMLLTARNCAGYFSLASSHFFFFFPFSQDLFEHYLCARHWDHTVNKGLCLLRVCSLLGGAGLQQWDHPNWCLMMDVAKCCERKEELLQGVKSGAWFRKGWC